MKQSVALSYLSQTNGLFLRLVAVGLIFLVGGVTILTSSSYMDDTTIHYPYIIPAIIIMTVGIIFLIYSLKMAIRASKQTELEKKLVYYQEKMIDAGTYIRDYYTRHSNVNFDTYTNLHKFQKTLYYASLFLISFKSRKLYDDLRYHPRGKTQYGANGDTEELGKRIKQILKDYESCKDDYCIHLRKKLGDLEILIRAAMDELDIQHKHPSSMYKITHICPEIINRYKKSHQEKKKSNSSFP